MYSSHFFFLSWNQLWKLIWDSWGGWIPTILIKTVEAFLRNLSEFVGSRAAVSVEARLKTTSVIDISNIMDSRIYSYLVQTSKAVVNRNVTKWRLMKLLMTSTDVLQLIPMWPQYAGQFHPHHPHPSCACLVTVPTLDLVHNNSGAFDLCSLNSGTFRWFDP